MVNTRKISLPLLCALLALLFLCETFRAETVDEYCASALTEADCNAKSNYCRPVKGQKCSSGEMTPPPCSLDFSNENDNNCCSTSSDLSRVHYLGCMPSNYVCLIQCVQYKRTGAVFVVWEGCGFTDSNFTDVSRTDECNQCYENVCPMNYTDITWVKYILEGSFLSLFLAFVLAMLPVIVLAYYIIKWRKYFYQYYFGKPGYQKLPTSPSSTSKQLEMAGLDPSFIQMIEQHPKYQKSLLQPVVREDRMIEIPMSDGTVRVVTPEKYQRLYISLLKKRVNSLESKRKQAQSPSEDDGKEGSSRDENADCSTSEGTSSDDELTSEKDPLV